MSRATRFAAFWAVAFASLIAFFAIVAHAYAPPAIAGHVTDPAGVLRPQERAALEDELEQYRRDTGVEIAVFLPRSLEGQTVEDVAYDTFNAWRLGQKDLDNGVLLVVATKERRVRIEVGKGIEDRLTDLQSSDIIQQTMAPPLREGRTFDALRAGSEAVMHDVSGKGAAGAERQPPAEQPAAPYVPLGAILFVLLVIGLRLMLARSGFWGGGFWGGGFGGGGGWGGGGGGGGGFSGGGGSSGGGGASGSY